mmetsp:Transcript_45153/g.83042  ORF Transcript_45153/g.83042 Transcript_45153/m.83042 type:complete len:81 (+) Transcript_45153:86-328(+)
MVAEVIEDAVQRLSMLVNRGAEMPSSERLDEGPCEGTLHATFNRKLSAPLLTQARRVAMATTVGHTWQNSCRQHHQWRQI